MADLYADENVPYPLVEALRKRGHDVLTALRSWSGKTSAFPTRTCSRTHRNSAEPC